MPPHLHPRSRMTSSLFATTVAVSFGVVAVPHILPCPAPRVAHADSPITTETMTVTDANGTTRHMVRRRRRRSPDDEQLQQSILSNNPAGSQTGVITQFGRAADDEMLSPREAIVATKGREKRECPVPKPGGVLGQLMGFKDGPSQDSHGENDGNGFDGTDRRRIRPNEKPATDGT